MFMGEYNHTLDTKGRLIIPSKFRETLGEKFVVTKGLDGCLFVYDNAGWTAFRRKASGNAHQQKRHPYVCPSLSGRRRGGGGGQAGTCPDPFQIKRIRELTKDVVLVGAAGHIEIWSQERWDALEEEAEESMEDIAERMDDLGL